VHAGHSDVGEEEADAVIGLDQMQRVGGIRRATTSSPNTFADCSADRGKLSQTSSCDISPEFVR
jgi:hypothetical protein